MLKDVLEKVGFLNKDNELHFDKALRNEAIKWACQFREESCLKATDTALRDVVHVRSSTILPHPNVRGAMYCGGYRSGGEHEQKFLLSLLGNSTDIRERREILNALGCNSNEELLKHYVQESVETKYSAGERYAVVQSVLENTVIGRDVLFDFLKDNIAKFHSVNGLQNTEKAIKELALYIVNEDQQKMVTFCEQDSAGTNLF